jgi:hypothetical protein
VASLQGTVAQHATKLNDILTQLGILAVSIAEIKQNTTKTTENQPPKPTENQPLGESSGENVVSNTPFSEGGIYARALKLDFPKFDGTDPMDWIQKAQQFFNYDNTPDDQKVTISAFHMQGKALTLYNWLMESGHSGGWEEFVVALKIRFAPSAYDNPIGAFTKLTQTTTVEEYQYEFEVLSNRISGLTEEFRVHTFLSGLKEKIRIMVTMLKPNCLLAAFGLTRLQEQEVLRRDHNQKVNT